MSRPCQGSSNGRRIHGLFRTKLEDSLAELYSIEEVLPARYVKRERDRPQLGPRSCAVRVRVKQRRLLLNGAAG